MNSASPFKPREPHPRARPRAWPLALFLLPCLLGNGGTTGHPDPEEPALVCPQYDPATSPLPSQDLEPLDTPRVGAIPGSFAVSQTGAATYSIPLVVPPGRAGMEPSLSIAYNSSAGEGLLGVGFGLQGLSVITRCPKNLSQDGVIRAVRYDAGDQLCLDGARLVEVGSQPGEVEYRTFPDSFRKVIAHTPSGWSPDNGPKYFEVFTKAGRVIQYGATPESRPTIRDGIVASWWMNSERDRRSNTITYHYEATSDPKDGHTLEIVPIRVEYAHLSGGPASRAVVIDYDPIPPRVSFAGGAKLTRSKLIKEIRMELHPGSNPTPVRRYQFRYDFGHIPETGRKVLESVSECDGPNNVCKPETTFNWSTHFRSLTKTPLGPRIRSTEVHDYDRSVWLMADVNGDGLDDIVVSEPDDDDETRNIWHVSLNLGGSFDAPRHWGTFTYPDYAQWWSAGATPMDYDQDGLTDIVLDAPNASMATYKVLHAKSNHTFELLDTGIPHHGIVEIGGSGEIPLKAEHHRFMRLGDVNGDGMADMIECVDPSWDVPAFSQQDSSLGIARWTVRLWSPTGNAAGDGPGCNTQPIPIPKYDGFDCAFARKEMYVVDIDGDGISEILLPDPDTGCGGSCQLNYTAQRLAGTTWEPVENTWLPQQTSARKIHFFDMNADGLPDALYTGFGVISPDLNEFPPDYFYPPSLIGADWNGNGVMDDPPSGAPWQEALELWMSDIPVLAFNKGGVFGVPTPTLPYPEATNDYWTDLLGDRALTLDYNGDGRMDVMMPMYGHCGDPHEETACWVAMIAPKTGADYFRIVDTQIPYDPPPSGRVHWWSAQVTDVDGDGRADILAPDPSDPGKFYVYKNDGPQDLLVGITDGTNPLDPKEAGFVPTVSIHYGNLVDTSVTEGISQQSVAYDHLSYTARFDPANDCEYPRACVVGTTRVVSGYAVNNGMNGERHFDMKYRDARYHRLGRGFLGFGARMLWDREAASGTAEFFDNTTFDQGLSTFPYAGQVVRSWSWASERGSYTDPGQIEVSFLEQRLQVVPTNQGKTYYTLPGATFVERQETVMVPGPDEGLFKHIKAVEGNPATVLGRTSHFISAYDEYGNILNEQASAGGIDLYNTIVRGYDNDPSTWLIGLLNHEGRCSTALDVTQCRATDLVRNQYGEVTSSMVGNSADPGTQLSTTFAYDDYGHVVLTTATDYWGNQRSSCVAYDGQGLFPYSTGNSLGHVTYTKYDSALGVLLAAVDPNRLTTRWAYDGFGRATIEEGPDTKTIVHRSRIRIAGLQGDEWGIGIDSHTFGGASTVATLDSFGRPRSVRTLGPGVPTCGETQCVSFGDLETTTTYDSFGRVTRVTLPWMVGDSLTGQLAHHYEYDAAGRLVRHIEPWGRTTTIAYANNTRTSLDWLASTSVEVDALGRVIRSVDGEGYATNTVYGPFSTTWRVSRDGTTKSVVTERDAYGRVTHEEDPDRGHSYVAYNGFGDVIGMNDALGRAYAFTYDGLGRLLTREDADGITSWSYDSAERGVGKLAMVTSPAGHSKEYGYDNLSRLSSTVLRLGDTGERLAAGYEYDGWGHLSVVTYPSITGDHPLVVRRELDDRGNVIAVRDEDTGQVYWTLDRVDGAGRATIETLGSPDFQTRRAYYPDRGLLASIQTDRGAARIQDLEYGYDYSQRMSRRTTRVGQPGPLGLRSEHFVHDKIDRLTCAGWSYADHDLPPANVACDLTMQYAPNGNILWKSDVGGYQYKDSAHPHAVTEANGSTYVYDAVGNQTQRPGVESISYTAFDLPSRIDRLNADSIRLDYDGDQHRIRKTTPEQDTIYFEDLYELVEDRITEAVKERHYLAAGNVTVVLTRDKTHDDVSYFLTDALGSTDVVVSGTGSIEQRSFDAFGAPRNPQWGEPSGGMSFSNPTIAPLGFTGHESDGELGLVNMKGRIYDPRIGRFLQTDPIVSTPHFGQSWNPYSYVHNSPLNFVDPSGFQAAPIVVPPTLIVGQRPSMEQQLGGAIDLARAGQTPPNWFPWPKDSGRDDNKQGEPSVPQAVREGSPFAAGGMPSMDAGEAQDSPGPVERTARSWGAFVGGLGCGFVAGCGPVHELAVETGVASAGSGRGFGGTRFAWSLGVGLGGAFLTAGGITGDLIGGAATTTGVGAVGGVPAIVASTAVLVGGMANLSAGMRGIVHAMTHDPPEPQQLVPSLRPPLKAPGAEHPFQGIPKGLHPHVFDIISDLQAARAGNTAAIARLNARNPHVLGGNRAGWTSLDIAGRDNPLRFIYKNEKNGIAWEVVNTHARR